MIQAVRTLSRILFAAYLIVLLWLVLFKLSYEPLAILRDFQTRGLNLIPFAQTRKSEMIANIVAFIPFGVTLGVNFKKVLFRHKIATIFAFSLAVEIIQFSLAIGVADITDIIMNTFGGVIGLAGYVAVHKYTHERCLDACILIAGALLLLTFLYLRIFVFIVKY